MLIVHACEAIMFSRLLQVALNSSLAQLKWSALKEGQAKVIGYPRKQPGRAAYGYKPKPFTSHFVVL